MRPRCSGRNDVPWECDGPEGRSLSTVRCERSSSTRGASCEVLQERSGSTAGTMFLQERSSSTRGASCDSRWVQPMPSGTPPASPTTLSSSATTRRVCRSPSAFSCSCRSLCSRQSRLLRHLHQEDRPDLVLPGRSHPRRGRDLGRRRARTGVRGNSSPPSLSTPCNIELGQHHQVITLSPACLSTIRSVFS